MFENRKKEPLRGATCKSRGRVSVRPPAPLPANHGTGRLGGHVRRPVPPLRLFSGLLRVITRTALHGPAATAPPAAGRVRAQPERLSDRRPGRARRPLGEHRDHHQVPGRAAGCPQPPGRARRTPGSRRGPRPAAAGAARAPAPPARGRSTPPQPAAPPHAPHADGPGTPRPGTGAAAGSTGASASPRRPAAARTRRSGVLSSMSGPYGRCEPTAPAARRPSATGGGRGVLVWFLIITPGPPTTGKPAPGAPTPGNPSSVPEHRTC